MKKFLLKIFKSPAMMFSVGSIAALAIFIFLQPQRFVAGMDEFNPSQAVAPATGQDRFLVMSSTTPENSNNNRDFGCFRGYKNWPHSATLKTDAPWSTLNMPALFGSSSEQQPRRNFIDLNGDGLVDFIFSNTYPTYGGWNPDNSVYYYRFINECVMLNNGSGWDIVFRCISNHEQNDNDFYGDCAQL